MIIHLPVIIRYAASIRNCNMFKKYVECIWSASRCLGQTNNVYMVRVTLFGAD